MKTARFTDIKKIEIADVPAPNLQCARRRAAAGPARWHLRLGRTLLSRRSDRRQGARHPATLGHECAGTVAETGRAVAGLRPGDRVAVLDPAIACGRCDQCLAGRPNTCRNLQFLGSPGEAAGRDGRIHRRARGNCFANPGRHDARRGRAGRAAFGRPARRAAGRPGGDVRRARETHSSSKASQRCVSRTLRVAIFVVGAHRPRRAAVRQGAGPSPRGDRPDRPDGWPSPALRGRLDRRCRGRRHLRSPFGGAPEGVDAAFECSGDPACLDQAAAVLAPGGTLCWPGIPSSDRVSFDVHAMRPQGAEAVNVRRQCGCVGPVIEMIRAGRLDARPLLTHCFPLERIGDAFELVAGHRDGVVKAVIEL